VYASQTKTGIGVRVRGTREGPVRTQPGRSTRDEFVPTELSRRIAAWFEHGCFPPILLVVGPAGIGKTYTVRHMASQMQDTPFFFIPATWRQSLEALMGYWELRDGCTRFSKGDLLKGLITPGACICIDDAHCLSQDLQLLNGVGDISREVVCAALGKKVAVAEDVKLLLLANPVPTTGIAPWERQKWEIPIQIRDRSLMIELSEGLSLQDERAILLRYWPAGHPTEVLDGLLEVCQHLRTNQVLESFVPSVRSLIITASELGHGLPLDEAFRVGISNKYSDPSERAAATEAFEAKFDSESEGGCTVAGPVDKE